MDNVSPDGGGRSSYFTYFSRITFILFAHDRCLFCAAGMFAARSKMFLPGGCGMVRRRVGCHFTDYAGGRYVPLPGGPASASADICNRFFTICGGGRARKKGYRAAMDFFSGPLPPHDGRIRDVSLILSRVARKNCGAIARGLHGHPIWSASESDLEAGNGRALLPLSAFVDLV